MTGPTTLAQLEERIIQLPLDEQLWLIERVTQHIREQIREQSTFDSQLSTMAADPDIQAELSKIDQEFAETESDGLEPDGIHSVFKRKAYRSSSTNTPASRSCCTSSGVCPR